MELARRHGATVLLAAAVGVLAAILKFAATFALASNMTVSCAHKRNTDSAGAAAAASSSSPASNLFIRDVLPTNVRPTHYDLTITPDMESFVFDGRVDVKYHQLTPSLPSWRPHG